MSKLTELIKQIPLDELMGDTDQVTEHTERIITASDAAADNAEKKKRIVRSGAYVKRSGALVSAAAIAIVAIGGAFAYHMLSKNSPDTTFVSSSSAAVQVSSQTSSQIPSKSNKAILEEYVNSKPEHTEGNYESSLDHFDVDASCGYALYRDGAGKCTLLKVSGGKVTEYSELKGITGERKYELPYYMYESQIFETGGSKYAALLTEIINDDGYYPAVTILKVDGDEPACAGIGHCRVTMEKYCTKNEYAESDVYKYPIKVISLKDVFKVTDSGVNIDGIDYSFENGDLVPAYRVEMEKFINRKTDHEKLEIMSAFTFTGDRKYGYGAYYDRSAGRSVVCRAGGQTVTEYPGKLFTGSSDMCITGRIYNMQSYTVANSGGGTKELLVILADKVTNGGIAPMIVVLDISSGSPAAVMSEPVMIDMTHYDKGAQTIKDGDTVIYEVSRFDDKIWTYLQTTDKGLRIDGKLYIIKNGKFIEDKSSV
ncbi:MAG: hypothetical protein K6F27_05125 [Ruminococcus sp.]|nr:hypothetical protein [Ruminococcus sp.]